jgi:hypothetical protein
MSVGLLESEIEKRATKQGENWIWMKCTQTHFPDRICFGKNGKTVFIEFKTPTGVVRPGQKIIHEKLKKLDQPKSN